MLGAVGLRSPHHLLIQLHMKSVVALLVLCQLDEWVACSYLGLLFLRLLPGCELLLVWNPTGVPETTPLSLTGEL